MKLINQLTVKAIQAGSLKSALPELYELQEVYETTILAKKKVSLTMF